MYYRNSWLMVGLLASFHCLSPILAAGKSLVLSPLFSDGAVLQRDKPLPVWGMAPAGDEVKVEFGSQIVKAKAGPDGRWTAYLEKLTLSTSPQVLRVTSASGETAEARDILVGDVWLCSGQSNMTWALENVQLPAEEIDKASSLLIRGWRSPLVASAKPEFSNSARWVHCVPRTAPGEPGLEEWSAVAFFFAREVNRETGVPIGLIMTSYGGTEIESWMSAAAVKDSGLSDAIMKRWDHQLSRLPAATAEWEKAVAAWNQEAAEAAKHGEQPKHKSPRAPEGIGSRKQPSSLYNAMVAPFVPYGLRGFLWYQGESNVPRAEEYPKLFSTLIKSWRADFGQGDLPFYFVQIANYQAKNQPPSQNWAFQREAQATALALPHTGMAVTIDVGDTNNLHPRNKLDVGRRLARYALKNEYGKEVVTSGPVFASALVEGASMRVKFRDNPVLELREAAGPAFEIAGADKKFFPATAKIEGSELLVSSPQVSAPVAVRYAWWNAPAAVLFGAEGLPASPFRSDDWPAEKPPKVSETN